MGGTADVTARLIAEKLRGSYAQTSLVDSRSGAGGRIAVDAPPADGATSLMTPMSTIAIYPHVFKSLSYNPFKHLAPVSLAATFTLGLAIGPAVPASVTDVRGLLDWMRANPKMGGLRVAPRPAPHRIFWERRSRRFRAWHCSKCLIAAPFPASQI